MIKYYQHKIYIIENTIKLGIFLKQTVVQYMNMIDMNSMYIIYELFESSHSLTKYERIRKNRVHRDNLWIIIIMGCKYGET